MDKISFDKINVHNIRKIMSEIINLLDSDPDNKNYVNTFEISINHIPKYIKDYNDRDDKLFEIDSLFIKKICDFLLFLALHGDENIDNYFDESYDDTFIFHFIHDGVIIRITTSKNTNISTINLINHDNGKFYSNINYNYPIKSLNSIIKKYNMIKYIEKTYIWK